jgi:hypothetical protein
MSRHRTPAARRAAAPPALFVALALALPGCGGSDSPTNVIRPLIATAVVDPDPAADPVLHLVKIDETGDLVTFELRLRTTADMLEFDAFNLEVRFDPTVVTLGDLRYAGGVLCACDTLDLACPDVGPPATRTLSCIASATTATGVLILGVAILADDPKFTVTPPDDVKLLTIAFRAAAPTTGTCDRGGGPVTGTCVDIVSDTSKADGSCEILNGVADLGVPCATGFVFTAQR